MPSQLLKWSYHSAEQENFFHSHLDTHLGQQSVGVVCSGLEVSPQYFWSFLFFATPTPEVEGSAGSEVGVGIGSFRGVFGPSNWTSCFRMQTSSPAAGADTVTGVVVVVVAGKVFFHRRQPAVARRLDFRLGVRGSDAVSPTHCSVGVAVVEIVGAVVVGTVTVSLWTTYGASTSSASSLSASELSVALNPGRVRERRQEATGRGNSLVKSIVRRFGPLLRYK